MDRFGVAQVDMMLCKIITVANRHHPCATIDHEWLYVFTPPCWRLWNIVNIENLYML